MKLPLGGEAGRQAIGGEREEIKKLPTTPPSALTATPLPSQHIISGRKEKNTGGALIIHQFPVLSPFPA